MWERNKNGNILLSNKRGIVVFVSVLLRELVKLKYKKYAKEWLLFRDNNN
jgi:hypothetical protein